MATDDYQFAGERSPITCCQSMVAKEEQLESANDKGILEIFDTLDIDDFDISGYDDDLVLEEGASIVSDTDYFVVEPCPELCPEPLPRETSSFMGVDQDVQKLLETLLPVERTRCLPDIRNVSVVPPSPIPSKEMGIFLSSNEYLEDTEACLPPPPPLSRRVVTPTLTTKKKTKKAKTQTKTTKKRAPRKKAPKIKQYVSKTDLDVLLGRGGCSNHHVGNATYRKRILELQVRSIRTFLALLFFSKTNKEPSNFFVSSQNISFCHDKRRRSSVMVSLNGYRTGVAGS